MLRGQERDKGGEREKVDLVGCVPKRTKMTMTELRFKTASSRRHSLRNEHTENTHHSFLSLSLHSSIALRLREKRERKIEKISDAAGERGKIKEADRCRVIYVS